MAKLLYCSHLVMSIDHGQASRHSKYYSGDELWEKSSFNIWFLGQMNITIWSLFQIPNSNNEGKDFYQEIGHCVSIESPYYIVSWKLELHQKALQLN